MDNKFNIDKYIRQELEKEEAVIKCLIDIKNNLENCCVYDINLKTLYEDTFRHVAQLKSLLQHINKNKKNKPE